MTMKNLFKVGQKVLCIANKFTYEESSIFARSKGFIYKNTAYQRDLLGSGCVGTVSHTWNGVFSVDFNWIQLTLFYFQIEPVEMSELMSDSVKEILND